MAYLKYYPSTYPDRLRKNIKTLHQERQSPGQESNLRSSKFKVEVLSTASQSLLLATFFPLIGNFSLCHYVQAGSGAHPASYPLGTGGKAARHEAGHSHPYTVEVKNAWSCTSTPAIHLHGMVLK